MPVENAGKPGSIPAQATVFNFISNWLNGQREAMASTISAFQHRRETRRRCLPRSSRLYPHFHTGMICPGWEEFPDWNEVWEKWWLEREP